MNLITDRTTLDVERWKVLLNKGWNGMSESERQEWLGETTPTPSAAKGMYTHNDLNRVESAVKVLSARLYDLGYLNSHLVVKTDWSYTDELTREDMERYYGNIARIRKNCTFYSSTPEAPTINQRLNHERANDIERILVDIDDISTRIPKSWYYAGEIMLGEV